MKTMVTDQSLSNASILHVQSDKEKKYDRQLRLWAASGQAALEEAHILLLNSGSGTVGVEVLKNLVLPGSLSLWGALEFSEADMLLQGIGSFTIADGTIVTAADLGVNFFLEEENLGKPRSQCCSQLLQELNPDSKGNWLHSEDVHAILNASSKYTIIVYTWPISSRNIDLVREYSQVRKIPLVSIHSSGFYSYFSLQLPGSFPIVDTHPDPTSTTDLRLLSPWPELSEFVDEMTMNIEKFDDLAHGHIPYVVLLLYYLEIWKTSHGGSPPCSYAEKKEFGKMIKAGARVDNPEGGEENFDEAEAAVLKNLNTLSLSSSVREIFEYIPSESESDSNFWIITGAMKKFFAHHKALPLPGAVPDMKAKSDVYLRLQNIYKDKARRDVVEVMGFVQVHPLGLDIPAEEIESYCKNAAFIKLIQENKITSVDIKELAEAQLNDEFALTPTLLPIYLALKASENCTVAASKDAIISEMSRFIPDANDDERLVDAAEEVSRSKGCELHNISALTGGMAAQEIIKVITKQYIPIDNTCVYDGITSRAQIFKL